MIVAVDLFCGAGGLTRGLEQAGINVRAGYDIDQASAYAYGANNKATFILRDVADVNGQEVRTHFAGAQYTLLAGCAPCQPFSSYANMARNKSDKWDLLRHFSRLVEETSPNFVTMENVPNLEQQPIFLQFLSALTKAGYQYTYQIVFCPDYGIPQRRRRLVLLASKGGSIALIPATHKKTDYLTVKTAIGHLPKLKAGETDKDDPLHTASRLSPLNMQRIRHSRPNGTWRDWPQELVTQCHKKQTGKSFPSVYGRMAWDKPSPTITTQAYGFGNGRFGHPEQDRALSLREAALLQTFSEDYKFLPPDRKITMRALGTLIGNAVPVRLGEIIGQSFQAYRSGTARRFL
ncbi:DNA cytosine methyltransferase [Bartonella sp. DGB2]|uniref:DNA cytosine methyltransferase n=1 Tax=Bartonella sp. DGB2 TaxID=3388426 RepID=UPI00398F94E4